MTTTFLDSIAFEVNIDDVWVDLTADVKIEPAPEWNMGIMNNTPTSRVGDPEYLSFCLDNSQGNSAGLIGYYTPGHANCRSGWTTGLDVRLALEYDGETFYKFYGKIMPDGIDVEPGIYGARTVDVRCHGFMAQAAAHDFALPELATNVRADQAVALVLANMPATIQPLETEYSEGVSTFPTAFDTVRGNTRAISEFQKIAMSELCYIYPKGDRTGGQTLVVESRDSRTSAEILVVPQGDEEAGFLKKAGAGNDYILLAGSSTDKIILNLVEEVDFSNQALVGGVEVSYGKNLTNLVRGRIYPRDVDAAATTVLFETQERIELAAGETKTGIRGQYRDPAAGADYVAGRDMVTPVITTDYTMTANSDGTGTDLSADLVISGDPGLVAGRPNYGTEAVEYTLQNTGASTGHVYIRARGKGIKIYDVVERIAEDSTSQSIHGVRPLVLEMKYQNDIALGENYANYELYRGKTPQTTVEKYEMLANKDSSSLLAFLYCEPGALVPLAEELTAVDGNYFVQGYSARIEAGKYIYWSPVPKSAGQDVGWILGTSALGTDTVLGFPQFD